MIIYTPPFEDLHLYCCPLMIPREIGIPAKGLEIIGTATLLQVSGRRFLVTARHVSDFILETHLMYPKSDVEAVPIVGKWIRSDPRLSETESPLREVDIAILPLGENELHPRYRFLGEGQLLAEAVLRGGIECVAVGYPSGSNKTIRNSIDVRPKQVAFQFPTLDLEKYSELNIDSTLYLAMEYDREVTRTDPKTRKSQKTRLPKLKGISGGPMWIKVPKDYALAAITSDQREGKRVIFGTRIRMALEMIYDVLQNE